MRRLPLLLGAAVALAAIGCVSPAKPMGEMMEMKGKALRVTIENVSGDGSMATPLAPGVWAVVATGAANPLFTDGAADAGLGLEALAEDGTPGALAAALAEMDGVMASGVFDTPDGADGPGVIVPGASYSFTVHAKAGTTLYFATMFVQSNDLFFAPGEGIELVAADGMAAMGDLSARSGCGTRAPSRMRSRESVPTRRRARRGPNTGPAENGVVHRVGSLYAGRDQDGPRRDRRRDDERLDVGCSGRPAAAFRRPGGSGAALPQSVPRPAAAGPSDKARPSVAGGWSWTPAMSTSTVSTCGT